MRSIIILKGLVKEDKKRWVREERLENYFLDMEVVRKLYSMPDLVSPERGEILSRAFGDTVYSRFMEIIVYKMSKGCLLVVDMDTEPTEVIENLAIIFGYTVFYVVQTIPQDYLSSPRKYTLSYQLTKKRSELEKNVQWFLNIQFQDKKRISTFQDILDYWKKEAKPLYIDEDTKILNVSDLHSNCDLYKKLPKDGFDYTIFYGDYIDGPVQGGSRRLTDLILKNKDQNTIFLEGNHEIRLRKYLGWLWLSGVGKKELPDILYSTLPDDFLATTSKEYKNLSPQEARDYLLGLNEKLRMFQRIEDKEGNIFISTHAGFKYLEQLDPRYIGGVVYGNRDMNRYDREFSESGKKLGLWSVHAHCKYPDSWEVLRYENVVNLDPPSESSIVYGIMKNKNWDICLLEKQQ